jgi:type I restriction enzyme S subunit
MTQQASHAWPTKRLRFAADINPAPPSRDALPDDAEVSFLPMEAIGEDGSLRLNAPRVAGEVREGYSYFADGDVAFAKVTPCFENGKGALMQGLAGGHGFGTTELTVLRPKAALDARFLHYFLSSPLFRLPGAGAMTGAGGLKRVPEEFTRNTQIPLPALKVQRRVANHLDRETARIDALIEKKTRFIELLREKRQALVTHAVTQGLDLQMPTKSIESDWLTCVPCRWHSIPLKYCTELLKDGTHLPPERVSAGVPLLSVRNLANGGFIRRDDDSLIAREDFEVLCRAFVPEAGDVMLAVVGATLGKCATVPPNFGEFHIQRSLAIFRGKSGLILNEWLRWTLTSSGFQSLLWEHAGFSAQPGIYLGTLGNR